MQAQIVPFVRPPLSGEEAVRIVQDAVGTERIGWTDHALQALEQRGISARLAMRAMSRGALKREPAWKAEYSDWVCIFCHVCCGRAIKVVVGVDQDRREVSVITVY